VRPVVVNWALPEAVAEVKKIVPVTLVLLGPDRYQVIGKYPDTGSPASPEYNNAGDVIRVVAVPGGMPVQLKLGEFQVIQPEVAAAGVVRADMDILALEVCKDIYQLGNSFPSLLAQRDPDFSLTKPDRYPGLWCLYLDLRLFKKAELGCHARYGHLA